MMKFLFLFVSILILQSINCKDNKENDSLLATTSTTQKLCEAYLPADTCANFRVLAQKLGEKTSILTDAVKEAILKHQTNAADMIGFIKGYIAERFPCESVLSHVLCKKIFDLGNKVHLTTLQIRLAIETAVNNGALTVQDIYSKAVDIMTTEITCEKIFSEVTCKNLKLATAKFHEQIDLINQAIIAAAQKNLNNVKDILTYVTNTIVDKAVNFKCTDVMLPTTCQTILEIGQKLHLTTQQIQKSIKEAIINGATTAKEIYDKTIYFFAYNLNCDVVLGQKACDNLVEIIKKLHEQRELINEAIVEAFIKHMNNTKDIINYVKNKIVEKAVNFQCNDVLQQKQCDFLLSLAGKFKLRTGEVTRVLIEAIVNGTQSAKQIYDVTIGQLIKDAKSIGCADLLPTNLCNTLDSLAEKFKIRKEEISIIVKTIVAGGVTTSLDIFNQAKNYLIDLISCDTFLGTTACGIIEELTARLHISFKKVMNKIKALVKSGITNIFEIQKKAIAYIWRLWFGTDSKRSLFTQNRFTQKVMEMVEKVITIGKDVKEKLKIEIQKTIEHGHITLLKLRDLVTKLITKYGQQSDDVVLVEKDIIDQLKEALKTAHGKARKMIERLLKKTKDELQKLKEYIKNMLGNNGDALQALDVTYNIYSNQAYQQLKDELLDGQKQVQNIYQ